MKVRTFTRIGEAVKYGHSCQQGGHNVALVIRPWRVYVCPMADAYKYVGAKAQVEFFWADEEEKNDVSSRVDAEA